MLHQQAMQVAARVLVAAAEVVSTAQLDGIPGSEHSNPLGQIAQAAIVSRFAQAGSLTRVVA